MLTKVKWFIFLVFLFVSCTSEPGISLVEADELKAGLGDENLLLVSTQSKAEFDSAHIPGSVHLFYKDLNNDVPVRGTLKSVREITSIFEKHGITRDKHIVVYDNGEAKYAGRLFWAMKYMGIENIRMLNGNFNAWTEMGGSVTSSSNPMKQGTFLPKVMPSVQIPLPEVKSKIDNPKTIIVDVRSPEEYQGTIPKSKGHIPGAINLPHTLFLDTENKIIPTEEINKILMQHEIREKDNIVLYCHTSTRAGLVFMILNSVMDYSNVRVFDGAYEGWSQAGNEIVGGKGN